MGVVFMAEQEKPVRRQVALKIIKAGMDTQQVVARFEAERQALAMMNHPHIAKVLDAGATERGRPYFVMELVKGIPITKFADKNKLNPGQRLELFIDVCHAVQHAHQKGIIHRDIKPSNVLVTLHDGKPVVKVIDFGLAKATEARLTERTLFTAFGQMVGTPAYMSPEQAEMSGLDIDTRTDVYSLGVLLYELLTGLTPLDVVRLREVGYGEMQRMICEDDPPPMSVRLSSLGKESEVLAGSRAMDPRRLSQMLRGDLDVIVLKSLEKDRSRRYESPNEFAADVARYINREVIEARPASASYRAKKFIQRNRSAVLMAGVVAVLLVAPTVTSTIFGLSAMEAQRVSDRERANALKAEQLATDRFESEKEARQDAEREKSRADKQRLVSETAQYAAQLRLANPYVTTSSSRRVADEILARTPPHVRSWEYERLETEWKQRRRMLANDRPYYSIDISPDGTKVAAGGTDAEVVIWNFDSGEEIARYRLPGKVCFHVRFSTDGRRVVARSDIALSIYDIESGMEVHQHKRQPPPVAANAGEFFPPGRLAMDRQGKYVAVAEMGSIEIWNANLSTRLRVHEGPFEKGRPVGLAFDPSGSRVVAFFTNSESNEKALVVYEVETGALVSSIQRSLGLRRTSNVCFDNSGQSILAIEDTVVTRGLSTLDAKTLEKTSSMDMDFPCKTFTMSPDGRRIALLSLSNDIQILAGLSGHPIKQVSADTRGFMLEDGKHMPLFQEVRFSADASRYVACAASPCSEYVDNVSESELIGGSVFAWSDDPFPASLVIDQVADTARTYIDAFATGGDWLATSVRNVEQATSTLKVRDLDLPDKVWTVEAPYLGAFEKLTASSDGRYLVATGDIRFPYVPDAERLKKLSPEERKAAAERRETYARRYPKVNREDPPNQVNRIRVYDMVRKEVVGAFAGPPILFDNAGHHVIAVDSNNRRVAALFVDVVNWDAASDENPGRSVVLVWDVTSGEVVMQLERKATGREHPGALYFGPQGDLILLKTRTKNRHTPSQTVCELIEVATGETRLRHEVDDHLLECAVHPSEDKVYLAGSGRLGRGSSLHEWDLQTDKIRLVSEEKLRVFSVSPDGRRLLALHAADLLDPNACVAMIDTQTYEIVFEMPVRSIDFLSTAQMTADGHGLCMIYKLAVRVLQTESDKSTVTK